jgi:hypothetical protein
MDHFKKVALIEHPPSTEEIDMMRERWGGFLKSMGSLDYDLYVSVGLAISSGPSLATARFAGELLRDTDGESTSTPARPNAPTKQRKAILDTNAPDEESEPPSEPKPSFFRALLRRILSSIFFKRFV